MAQKALGWEMSHESTKGQEAENGFGEAQWPRRLQKHSFDREMIHGRDPRLGTEGSKGMPFKKEKRHGTAKEPDTTKALDLKHGASKSDDSTILLDGRTKKLEGCVGPQTTWSGWFEKSDDSTTL